MQARSRSQSWKLVRKNKEITCTVLLNTSKWTDSNFVLNSKYLLLFVRYHHLVLLTLYQPNSNLQQLLKLSNLGYIFLRGLIALGAAGDLNLVDSE
jgi:hypothetical protein